LGLARSFIARQRRAVPSKTAATILVLEESASIQELIDQALRDDGHRVLSTKNALEALEVVRRVRIDIVVASEVFGSERQTLIDELGWIQPGLQVVTICGPDDDLPTTDGGARLSSPLSLDDLCEAVSLELDRRRHV
jgi:DNA-binding NtrC family response regulator